MNPLISVILPTYNRQHFLSRSLGSILAQTYEKIEVLVVDDGSDEAIEQRVKELAPNDPRIKYFKTPHGGVSRARNKGIHEARGAWLAFLDSDDEWHPEKLEKQLKYNLEKGWLISQTEDRWVRDGRQVNPARVHHKQEGDFFFESLKRCMISMSAVMIHETLFQTYGVFDEKLPACEDYDLFLRITKDLPVGLVRETLITRYAGHEDQLSFKYAAMDRFRVIALIKILKITTSKKKKEKIRLELLSKSSRLYRGAWKRKLWVRSIKYFMIYQSVKLSMTRANA